MLEKRHDDAWAMRQPGHFFACGRFLQYAHRIYIYAPARTTWADGADDVEHL